ncbi:hypothetical protein Ahy_B07g087918 [Arachis hypogaea]|uniref:Uncharacterized protein n=1 Tax=Arachis hypogaea TaxID=3818 RepID=A0A444YDC1_ARAHY|nr:hypothetical protein Ahy_B07g087918 [Arachis hypogaea]
MVLATMEKNAFSELGFSNWKKLNNAVNCVFVCHEGSILNSPYNLCVKSYDDLMAQSKHIDKVLDRHNDEIITNNCLRLKTSINVIQWLTFQTCDLGSCNQNGSQITINVAEVSRVESKRLHPPSSQPILSELRDLCELSFFVTITTPTLWFKGTSRAFTLENLPPTNRVCSGRLHPTCICPYYGPHYDQQKGKARDNEVVVAPNEESSEIGTSHSIVFKKMLNSTPSTGAFKNRVPEKKLATAIAMATAGIPNPHPHPTLS